MCYIWIHHFLPGHLVFHLHLEGLGALGVPESKNTPVLEQLGGLCQGQQHPTKEVTCPTFSNRKSGRKHLGRDSLPFRPLNKSTLNQLGILGANSANPHYYYKHFVQEIIREACTTGTCEQPAGKKGGVNRLKKTLVSWVSLSLRNLDESFL